MKPRHKYLVYRPSKQRGVLLVVVLIMLVVLSVLASISIRGSSSSEQITNNSRLKALAQQAAESALLQCEKNTQLFLDADAAKPGVQPQAAPASANDYIWKDPAQWDATTKPGFLEEVTFNAFGDIGAVKFTRKPECMAQYSLDNPNIVVVTARGFGPEVGARDGKTPKGTEIWLQSSKPYFKTAP